MQPHACGVIRNSKPGGARVSHAWGESQSMAVNVERRCENTRMRAGRHVIACMREHRASRHIACVLLQESYRKPCAGKGTLLTRSLHPLQRDTSACFPIHFSDTPRNTRQCRQRDPQERSARRHCHEATLRHARSAKVAYSWRLAYAGFFFFVGLPALTKLSGLCRSYSLIHSLTTSMNPAVPEASITLRKSLISLQNS